MTKYKRVKLPRPYTRSLNPTLDRYTIVLIHMALPTGVRHLEPRSHSVKESGIPFQIGE